MGFADHLGFRAGTSKSFFWYDLENEKHTELRVHPFCVMDVTLKNYQKYQAEHGEFILANLLKETEKVGGTFRIICHNESLSNYGEWKDWKEVLLNFI